MTRAEIEFRLQSGKTLCVDRRDCPELPVLLAMEREGLVKSRLVEVDEQCSVLKFWWNTTVVDEQR